MENGSKEEELDLESINQEDVTALGPNLVTLGLSPHIQWASLLHLDSIKARNKPVEPLKKPERAPFFLDALAAPNDDASAALISDAHAQVDKDSGRQSKKLKVTTTKPSPLARNVEPGSSELGLESNHFLTLSLSLSLFPCKRHRYPKTQPSVPSRTSSENLNPTEIFNRWSSSSRAER